MRLQKRGIKGKCVKSDKHVTVGLLANGGRVGSSRRGAVGTKDVT